MIWRFKFYSEFYSAAWTLRNKYRGLATVNDLFTPGPTPAQRQRRRLSDAQARGIMPPYLVLYTPIFGVVHSHIWCCTLSYLVLYTPIFGVFVHSHIWCCSCVGREPISVYVQVHVSWSQESRKVRKCAWSQRVTVYLSMKRLNFLKRCKILHFTVKFYC